MTCQSAIRDTIGAMRVSQRHSEEPRSYDAPRPKGWMGFGSHDKLRMAPDRDVSESVDDARTME